VLRDFSRPRYHQPRVIIWGLSDPLHNDSGSDSPSYTRKFAFSRKCLVAEARTALACAQQRVILAPSGASVIPYSGREEELLGFTIPGALLVDIPSH
jgi:hypothetical protein